MQKHDVYCAVNGRSARQQKYYLGVRRPSGIVIVAEFYNESARDLVIRALEAPEALKVLVEEARMAAE